MGSIKTLQNPLCTEIKTIKKIIKNQDNWFLYKNHVVIEEKIKKGIERKKNRQMENEKSYRTGPSRIGRKHTEPRVVGNREKQERTYLPRS